MMTKSDASTPVQANLFKVLLRDIVYPQHELILLRDAIDWGRFEKALEPPTGQSIMSRWRSRVGGTGVTEMLKEYVARSRRLLAQDRDTPGKDKIYSFHEPQVECIAKGKVHTRHEFGVKASFVTASRDKFTEPRRVGAFVIHPEGYTNCLRRRNYGIVCTLI